MAALLMPAALHAASAASPRIAVAVRAAGAVTVDGKLDEPAWQRAPEQAGFVMPVGVQDRRAIPAELQTSFRVLFDDDRLYLGIVCREPEPAKLVAEAAPQHDAAMWSDDAVEVFLDPVGDRRVYYHFAVNSQGTQFDSYPAQDGLTSLTTWSTEWQAATAVEQAAWTVEIALPFAALNQTPAATWSDRWAFNVARTRAVSPGYNSVFAETTNGYHDPARFGTLTGVVVDRGRYGLAVGRPALELSPRGSEYHVTAAVPLANQGKTLLAGVVELQLGAERGQAAPVAFSLPPQAEQTVQLAGHVRQLGKHPVIIRATDAAGRLLAVSRTQETLTYEPIRIKVEQPSYRNAIYPTQQVTELRGTVLLAGHYPNDAYVTVSLLDGQGSELATARLPIKPDAHELHFALPVQGLAAGEYTLPVTIWWHLPGPCVQVDNQPPPAPLHPLVRGDEITLPLRVLPPAPAVEVRVDGDGRLLVDGQPVFIRGWYGSTAYLVSAASPVASRLPQATNFIMGASPEQQANQGLYCLESVTDLIDENKAKLDQPIDDDLRAKLRQAVERVRGRHNVIGYYLSDEPECRGLSPVYLQSAYEFLAQEDPYRLVMIVSRSPREYMAACDVMCPHPYTNPQETEGKRSFATPLGDVRKVLRQAVAANDGGKAVWCMPQVFRYNGPNDRHPTLRESRWTVCTALANGATGIVPFIFNAYWNHRPNRLALDRLFDELTILAPAWLEPGAALPVTSSDPAVDVTARSGPAPARHTYIVAANQGRQPCRATLQAPTLATGMQRRLVVLGENRVVAVSPDGSFTDDFDGLGAHVYTTLEVLPILPTLQQVEGEIARLSRQAAAAGNLLADPAVEWSMVEPGWNFSDQGDLADGVTNAAAWLPAYGDRTKCEIAFARPLRFSRVVVYTPTIKAARLEIKQGGKWQVLHTWTDQLLPRLVHSGQAVTAEGLRIVPTEMRSGPTGPGFPEITELELYQ